MARARAARAAGHSRAAGGGARATTASDRTKSMVVEAHRGVVRALAASAAADTPGLGTAVLKTASTLLGVTPYDRLDPGLATTVADALRPLVRSRHQGVVVAALQCVGSLVTAKGCHAEVRAALFDGPTPDGPGAGADGAPLRGRPGLLRLLVTLAQDRTAPDPVRSEVLAALAKTSRHFARALSLAWPRLAPVLSSSFAHPQAAIRASGLRVLEELLRARAAEAAALGGAETGTVAATARTGTTAGVPGSAAGAGAAPTAAAAASAAARGAPATGQYEPLVPARGSTPARAAAAGEPAAGWPETGSPPFADGAAAGPDGSDPLPLPQLMAQHLPRAMRDPAVPVRATACMCVSYLLPADWQAVLAGVGRRGAEAAAAAGAGAGAVPPGAQADGAPSGVAAAASSARWGRNVLHSVLASVHTATADDSATVRAAGCRVLGAFSSFGLWKHPWFARQAAAHLLRCVGDDVLNVRARAAWGLGCICAAPALVSPLPPTLHASALARAVTTRRLDAAAAAAAVIVGPGSAGAGLGAPDLAADPADATPGRGGPQSPLRPVTALGGPAGAAPSSGAAPPSAGSAPARPDGAHLTRLLGPALLRDITAALVRLCDDHDRVAASAARTLGLAAAGVLTLPPGPGPADGDLVAAGAGALCRLVREAGSASPKTRWNACYALGVVLAVEAHGPAGPGPAPAEQQPAAAQAAPTPPHKVTRRSALSPPASPAPSGPAAAGGWRSDGLDALGAALSEASHFKVRIAAAQALGDAAAAVPAYASRACRALALGLVRAEAATDFTEYRYKPQLEAQAAEALQRALSAGTPDAEALAVLREHASVIARVLRAAGGEPAEALLRRVSGPDSAAE